MDTLLKEFPVITEIKVAWGEMDALQHVNNAVYFRYFETARLDYFHKINLLVDLQTSHIGPVLSETQCRYKLPVTFPDTLLIGSRVIDMQDDRMTMEYQVLSKKWGKILVPGHCDPTANVHDWYVGVRNGKVETVWPVSARGKAY